MKNFAINKVGNLLPCGNFILHSTFNNVVNLVNETQHVLSFSDSPKFLNPNTILTNSESLPEIKKVRIFNNQLEIFGKIFQIDTLNTFNSFFDFSLITEIDLKSKIRRFENDFLHRFNPKSLRFLLDEKFEQNFQTSFDKAFVKYVKNAFNEIQNGDFYAGISKMKGAGFGLTPSGDDFIAGMLYAFNVLENFSTQKITIDIEKIRKTAKGKNPISNSLIYYASKGAYYKRFKDFLEAFLYDEKNLEKAFKNLIEIGETSSSDTLTGFLTTFHNALRTN